LTPTFKHSPPWFRTLNSAWKSTYPLGTKIRLDKDDLIRRARKATGLTNLGKEFNDVPIEKLLLSINDEARLHPIGRFITRERFVNLLNIRLRAEYFFNKNPQILEQELYPAWFIIGLQRSGTTKLQRLLAVDPDHRVIPSWEVINPVPVDLKLYDPAYHHLATLPPHHLTTSPPHHLSVFPHPHDKRISIARAAITSLRYISPGFFAVHPIDIMQPEEDILLLDVSFMSTTPEATMHVPAYAQWLETTDQSESYAYAVKLLKFLQWIRPAKRWVLKSPHHLEFPDLIEKHFGKVHFLWPHRELTESIPSFLSMVTYNRMIFSDRVREEEVAGHWVRKIGYMLDKAISFRQQPGKDSLFIDMDYKNLIVDSIAELEKIYRLNGGMTPDLVDRFCRHELEHPHRKHGVHQYSMEDFGLTDEAIGRHTWHYHRFFNKNYG
jgi:hypothetical protein